MTTARLLGGWEARATLPAPLTVAAGRQHTAETILRAWFEGERIRFEALLAGVVPLEAEPAHLLGFPDPDEPDAVSRGQRHVQVFGAVKLGANGRT